MNDRDSEIMTQLLADNHRITNDPAAADTVIVNTCSIRAKAEQKAFSLLGALRKYKKTKPEMVIVASGCVAQQEGKKIFSRMNHVDLVIGPQYIYKLPGLINQVKNKRKKIVAIEFTKSFTIPPFLPTIKNGLPHKRFVTIMQGCNNYCTYCIVPYVRGREISRAAEDIIAEVRHLAAHGIREITLLGQNVNSYGNDRKGELPDFARLLRQVSTIKGVERLRFTTSNPKDLSDELIACFADLDNLCAHFHLPVQSGSNRILQRMNRKYSIESYLERVEKLHRARPDIALTTDIIVGFPGESDDDFTATMNLLETVRFHGSFSFIYSSRPPARSCEFTDTIADEIKSRRLARYQARQKEITMERHEEYVGRIMEIMVEGESRNRAGQWCGRTTTNHIINFDSPKSLVPGQIFTVKITEACFNSLRGILVDI
jgi:tRNA-2-methylthio-N6-dimethylallyladenosine synthase